MGQLKRLPWNAPLDHPELHTYRKRLRSNERNVVDILRRRMDANVVLIETMSGDVLLLETAKAAIQGRADFPTQSEPALFQHPQEFKRLLLLAGLSRLLYIASSP
jgi:hypothetical protein